jgi:hypothetical protein
MSAILQYIDDNLFDLAIQLLREKGNKVSNAKNIDGVSALMLATKLKPVSKAIELIDALMKAGASINKRDNNRRHVLLFACENGVDPIIFDKLLKWNSVRKNILKEWWVQCDIDKNGVFILACMSQNFDLAKHVLSIAFTKAETFSENFLESRSNHILKAMELAVMQLDEIFVVRLIRLSREFVDEIGNELEIDDEFVNDKDLDPFGESLCNSRTIYLTDIFRFALDHGMFHFIVEYETIFNPDYKFKETIWKWMHYQNKDGRIDIPVKVQKFALSYEKNELWKKNKDTALVLLRVYKNRYKNDILDNISSFLYSPSLDVVCWLRRKALVPYPCNEDCLERWIAQSTLLLKLFVSLN